MTGVDVRKARARKGCTQEEAAARLGISQPYLSLLERGRRRLSRKLMERAIKVLDLPATRLPPHSPSKELPPNRLARELGALGYPGFAYLSTKCKRNPAELIVSSLLQNKLEARLVEALPWVLLNYTDLDWQWLLEQARLNNLQNRLGFLVSLALSMLEQKRETDSRRSRNLGWLEQELESSRLVVEDAFDERLSPREREWLRGHRSDPARHWNLLSNLSAEYLSYAP